MDEDLRSALMKLRDTWDELHDEMDFTAIGIKAVRSEFRKLKESETDDDCEKCKSLREFDDSNTIMEPNRVNDTYAAIAEFDRVLDEVRRHVLRLDAEELRRKTSAQKQGSVT